MFQRRTKIAYPGHFGRTHFCARMFEKSQIFFPDVQNEYFSARTVDFVQKWATIEPIMHKKAIKHENIGGSVFTAQKALKFFFRPLKH